MIVKNDKDQLANYLEDTSNISGNADVVYVPQNIEELSELLREMSAAGTPVTFSAGGTGTTGGRVAPEGAIVSVEALNHIIAVDLDASTIRVEAGVSLTEIEKTANSYGLSLRSQPTEPLALIGGGVSTCASGPKSFKYGSIRQYILAIKAVLSDGTVLDIRRGQIFAQGRHFSFKLAGRCFDFDLPTYSMPEIKHAAGYYVKDDMDLIDLFIGQEGTLACIVEITLQLQGMPLDFFDALVFFEEENEGLDFVERMKGLKRAALMYPCSVEFFDANALAFLREDYAAIPECACGVYFEQEIDFPEQQDKVLEYYCGLIEECGATLDECWFADSATNRNRLAEFRHRLPQKINEFLRHYGTRKTATDIAVPDDQFRQMYALYKDVAQRSGMHYVNFGHIGQNHLHFNFLPRSKDEEFMSKGYIMELIHRAVEKGGTVSAEHGIGKIKKPYLEIMYGKAHLQKMAALKKVFDPACILNLDNMFDRQLLAG
jgi:D-lactate dehydrogenase (cytochrome)